MGDASSAVVSVCAVESVVLNPGWYVSGWRKPRHWRGVGAYGERGARVTVKKAVPQGEKYRCERENDTLGSSPV